MYNKPVSTDAFRVGIPSGASVHVVLSPTYILST